MRTGLSHIAVVVASLAVLATASATEPSRPTSPAAEASPPASSSAGATSKPSPAPKAATSGDAAPAQAPLSPHTTPPAAAGAKTPANKGPAKPEKKVDLNNASLAELQTLPTVGEAEAKKIIANRPYSSKMELVTKAGLPEGVYYAVRYKVSMQKPRQAAPKK